MSWAERPHEDYFPQLRIFSYERDRIGGPGEIDMWFWVPSEADERLRASLMWNLAVETIHGL